MAQVIELSYAPRPFAMEIHRGMSSHRFGAVVAHRRFGKTVCAINHLQVAALRCKLERPRFAFIGPTYTQAKTIAFDYLLHYSHVIPGVKPKVSELSVDYPNGGQVRLFGADNPDALRGIYLDGVVFDEYGLQPPNIFSEVIRPALSDRQGWALFLGTPAGKNQFYEVIQQARTDSTWYFAEFKASQTGIIAQEELAAARKDMTADEYAQEYECSFEASVKGAIYAGELESARAGHRVGTVPYDPILPVDTDWDLGVGDATAIWFSQSTRSGEVRLIDYYETSGEGLPHYAQVLTNKGYTYGQHWAPHDIAVRELGSGRSRLETAGTLGIRFQIAPNIPLEDGIHAARMLFPRCYFDESRCKAGLEALQHYRRDFNTRLNEFKPTPVHDWCVTGDTKVVTRYGTHQIQYLPEFGEVLTPCGWKPYEHPRITRRNAPLVEVVFSDGLTVRCTPEHKFLTANGWKCASELQTGLLIQSSWTRWRSISQAISIGFGRLSAILRGEAVASIGMCGAQLLGLFRTTVTFTTETATQPITHLVISNAYQPESISAQTGFVTWHNAAFTSPLLRGLNASPGISQKSAERGIAAWESDKSHGSNGSEWKSLARTVGQLWQCLSGSLGMLRSIVQRRAKPLRIASVTALDGTADVWCLTVPDGHQWSLENGAVVHNSEHGASAFRYLAVRHKTKQDDEEVPAYRPRSVWG